MDSSKHTIELNATAFELVGVGILVLGSIIVFVHYLVTLIRLRKNHVAYKHMQLNCSGCDHQFARNLSVCEAIFEQVRDLQLVLG